MQVSRHITGENILPLKNITYPQNHLIGKPNGFYTSDGSWEEWMAEAGFSSSGVSHAYTVTSDLSRALTISSVEDLQNLVTKYEMKIANFPDVFKCIDWTKVSSDYTAVVFTNYYEIKKQLFTLEKGYFLAPWYFGLDCNCCCIFDVSIIQSIVPIDDYNFDDFCED
jgi:hypothetical protein